MFLASRWILGFGIPFAIINASSLIGELSYAKERPIMTRLAGIAPCYHEMGLANLSTMKSVQRQLVCWYGIQTHQTRTQAENVADV